MFKHVFLTLAVKKKREKFPPVFCLYSSVTELQKSPPPRYISGCFKGDWGSRLLRAPCFVLILELFQFTHIRTLCAAVWSKAAEVRTYCLIPAGAVLSVCRVPSLTQTAALLQSSVVHFVVAPKKVFRQLLRYSFYFLSIPKGNRSLFLFSLFLPFWTGTNNRPFPLHSWCWMSEGGSQRSRNILLEWYVESSSLSLPFFLSPVMDFKDAATIPCLKGNS